jgi:putative transposase
MKKSRFSDAQILAILKQAESGVPVPELCREHGMSGASFYKWRAKYGGMDASLMAEMKTLSGENQRLKRMFAELSMQNELLKEALGKSPEAVSPPRDGRDGREGEGRERRAGLPDLRDQRGLLSIPTQARR